MSHRFRIHNEAQMVGRLNAAYLLGRSHGVSEGFPRGLGFGFAVGAGVVSVIWCVLLGWF